MTHPTSAAVPTVTVHVRRHRRRCARRRPWRRPGRARARRGRRDGCRAGPSWTASSGTAGRSTACRPASGRWRSTFVAPERRAELQHALIRSHAAGIGAPMPREVVRAMMLLRVRSLAMGLSGRASAGRPGAGRPAQPRHHAVGARARVARRLGRPGPAGPLRARAARRGLGARQGRRPRARRRGAAPGRPAPDRAGAPRKGWPSSTAPTACSACCCWPSHDARHLFTMADVTAALAIEAMLGSDRPFLPELHAIRPHPGQAVSAANIHRLLQGSADHGLAPRRHDPRRAGRLLDALRAPGGRRGPGHAGLRRPGRRPGAGVRCGQPGRPPRRPGAVDRQLPRRPARASRPTSWPSPPPRWARSRSDGSTACSTCAARATCRRSSPPTRGSTPA